MAEYKFDLFPLQPFEKGSVSSFKVEIEPPIDELPGQPLEDYSYDGLVISPWATTESVSVYRIDHTREQLPRAERVRQVVSCLNIMSALLNGVNTERTGKIQSGK